MYPCCTSGCQGWHRRRGVPSSPPTCLLSHSCEVGCPLRLGGLDVGAGSDEELRHFGVAVASGDEQGSSAMISNYSCAGSLLQKDLGNVVWLPGHYFT